jgi:membrane protein
MRRGAHAVEILREVFHRCVRHSVDTQSAALAFYTLFSLAPVLLVVGSLAGRFFGEARVHAEIVRQFQNVMGPDVGAGVASVLEKAAGRGTGGGAAAVAGFVAFILGATAVFIQLQEALNRVWAVAPRRGALIRSLLKRRFVSFALVLAIGFLLLVSLTLSAGLEALTDTIAAQIPLSVGILTFGNEILSFSVFTVLIAMIYRVLPDARLEWRDVRAGAVVTSILFSIGKWLIGYYLGRTTVASRFGVAGSMVVILLYVYFTSYIVLFGAELTAVSSSRRREVRPEPGARRAGG